jgi:tryptophan synthase alpha chain
MRLIARRSRGFIYVVSLTGVTGVREALSPDLVEQLRALRVITTRPICVGFGISTPDHVRAVAPYADGVIVGSAVVRLVEQHAGSARLVDEVGKFIASMKAPLLPGG